MQEYNIAVNTGSRTDADTKGTIFITLHGEDGATRRHELKKGFAKSKKQTVKLQALDAGPLTKATLHTASEDGWFVESLLIHRTGDAKAKATHFAFDRWVQHPESPSVTTTRSVDYQIQAKTGMLAGAGSTGQFFLKIFGTHGETQRLPLATGF